MSESESEWKTKKANVSVCVWPPEKVKCVGVEEREREGACEKA